MPKDVGRVAFVASRSPDAKAAEKALKAAYPHVEPKEADIVVALGGDGLMLSTLHDLLGTGKPIYGMHKGTVGFLMNEFRTDRLMERLAAAQRSIAHPLLMRALDVTGREHQAYAVNEVHMLRQTHQTAKLTIEVDGKVRLTELISDGVLLATPAGSTAYNLSVGGPILPLDASLLALTPISAFRPRRWRGALLPDRAKITVFVNDPETRPVSAVADHFEFRRVKRVTAQMDHSVDLVMLHDPGHGLDERILREQFGV